MTPDIYDLGSKRELFADDFFIGTLLGNCQRRINNPLPDDIVFTLDEEHEKCNSSSCFNSIIFDGKRYLFYYRTGLNLPTKNNPESREEACLCVAESYDGINFKRCQVNLFRSGYNVVLDTTKTRHLTPAHLTDICPAVTTAFYDTNPACPENEKYKLIVTNERPPASDERGMYLFVSADGFDFHQKTGKFKLDERSGYDSANQAFFDHNIGKYRLYHRCFKWYGPDWKRYIFTHVTEDFETFTDGQYIEFDSEFDSYFAIGQELYTNAIRPYFRAPHILLGFPMRYNEGSMTPGLYATTADWNERVLSRPGLEDRIFRAKLSVRYAIASTDTVLIASRDGFKFKGHGESFITPPPTVDSWVYGSGSVCLGMMVSPAKTGYGAPDELSFLVPEGNWGEDTVRFRRYRLRMDGFVSLHFGMNTGSWLSPKFTFKGGMLTFNVKTGGFGGFKVELRDEKNNPIPGYTFADSYELIGDNLDIAARWRNGKDVRPLENKVISIAFLGRNCDLYSVKFEEFIPDPELPDIVSKNITEDIQKPE